MIKRAIQGAVVTVVGMAVIDPLIFTARIIASRCDTGLDPRMADAKWCAEQVIAALAETE